MEALQDQFLWVEKYRPQVVSDCILAEDVKSNFLGFVKDGRVPNLLLSGSAGTGKTTVAKALCNELGVDYIVINGSEDNGIDAVRTKITQFGSSASLMASGKCIIIDEADYLTANAQAALRNVIETFSKSCSFIFTCNFVERIIDPIQSRLSHIQFGKDKQNETALTISMFKRCTEILIKEGVAADQIDKKALMAFVAKVYPDNRKILNELQQFAKSGAVDAGILMSVTDVSIESLVSIMRGKKYTEMRQWVAQNKGQDLSSIYKKLYAAMSEFWDGTNMVEAHLIMGEYNKWHNMVADIEVHVSAMLGELMVRTQFKG